MSGRCALRSASPIDACASGVSPDGAIGRQAAIRLGVRLDLLLHHLARAHQIHRSLGIGLGELQRAIDHILDVAAGADLRVVAHIAAHEPRWSCTS